MPFDGFCLFLATRADRPAHYFEQGSDRNQLCSAHAGGPPNVLRIALEYFKVDSDFRGGPCATNTKMCFWHRGGGKNPKVLKSARQVRLASCDIVAPL